MRLISAAMLLLSSCSAEPSSGPDTLQVASNSQSRTTAAPPDLRAQLIGEARAAVLAELPDPESARFSNEVGVLVEDGIVCGYVNAKNASGGYAGNTHFLYNRGSGVALPGEEAYIGSRESCERVFAADKAKSASLR